MANDLQFLDLEVRHYGLTKAVASNYAEAACVCLERHHDPTVEMTLEDNSNTTVVGATWQPLSSRAKVAWNNADDATRDGAYALAIAAIEKTRSLFAIGRAETATGADYYVAPAGDAPEDLENSFRLEVSGIDKGPDSKIKQRLKQKLKQAENGASDKPAIACVVAFEALRILTADLE